ncbi:MAG: hypothetical protein U0136_21965 [Bdellovibrionota bacterium]
MKSPLNVQLLSAILLIVATILLLLIYFKIRRSEAKFDNPRLTAIFLGLLWGVVIRSGFSVPSFMPYMTVMSTGFLFLIPLLLGCLTILFLPAEAPVRRWEIVFLPWVTVSLSMLVAGLVGFEGLICIVMAAPIWLIFASIGGAVGSVIRRSRLSELHAFVLVLLISPLGISVLEQLVSPSVELRTITNETLIRAEPEVVWQNIRTVKTISAGELRPSLVRSMGFPDPIAAELSGEGIGAVRRATFQGGVEFTETVTEWQPNEVIAFHIQANTDKIPRTTLDEHVTIGGDYFDTLQGKYEILPLSDGSVRLRLSSDHRLSTHFNWYAGIWSDFVMSEIQSNILHVIRRRCEEISSN